MIASSLVRNVKCEGGNDLSCVCTKEHLPRRRYLLAALSDSYRQTAIDIALGASTLEWAESVDTEGAESGVTWFGWSSDDVIEGVGATSRLGLGSGGSVVLPCTNTTPLTCASLL